ncbi:MAG: methyltransferase domain-containing protein [Methanosarcinales archaeon]|nr:methyltransferase domain-containing protein [Methanosarcinales archaeon]
MIKDIDWNKMWIEAMESASWRKHRGDMTTFWDKRAKRFSESLKDNNRSKQTLSKVDIDPSYTVLDIGAGPGTLTIPLAKIAKHVTVVEPSPGMLACLKENAKNEGLKNISCINKKWEDVYPGNDLNEYDVVIASYSLAMLDIKTALRKMDTIAKHSVYLFTFAGDHMFDYGELWPALYNEQYKGGPDYIYLYNILYQMGIKADVEISTTEHKQYYSNMDDAVEQWMENIDIFTPDAKEVIRSHLSTKLIKENGSLLSKNIMKSAVVCWKKDTE